MKSKHHHSILVLAILTLCTLNAELSTAMAQATAFTYQGLLQDDRGPANGSYDLQFILYTASVGGSQTGPILTNSATAVTNGLFTLTLDFEPGVFTGSNYWLDIAVRTNGGDTFAELTPRQPLTPTPYAIYAPNAGSANTASSANSVAAANVSGILALTQLPSTVLTNGQTGINLSGTFGGNGSGLSNLNISASQLFAGANNNIFVGPSGNSTAAGSFNTALGNFALGDATNASNNTAIGFDALQNLTSGLDNTAIGTYALAGGGTGTGSGGGNTALGYQALTFNMTGNFNTAIGWNSLSLLGGGSSGGTNNIALGFRAGIAFTENESSNIDIGNIGVGGENNTIRIGSSQTAAYIAGVINGDGGGLTNLQVSAAQLIGGAANDVFLGPAGNATSSGAYNTAAGYAAMASVTRGFQNTANGAEALFANTSGAYNTAVGVQALKNNTNGSFNTAAGDAALYDNTSGSYNTADGLSALSDNTTGSYNTAVGPFALFNNLTGSFNTAIGEDAITFLVGGTNNTALGYQAGHNFTGVESGNIDIGNNGVAGENNIIRIGDPTVQTAAYIAGLINGNGGGLTNLTAANLTGALPALNGANLTSLTAVNLTGPLPGLSGANLTNLNASQLTSVGNTTGENNFFVGNAGNASVSGFFNTAMGYTALAVNSTGGQDTAIGNESLQHNTSGSQNTALGSGTLYSNTLGAGNTATGFLALRDTTTGDFNTATGVNALGQLGHANGLGGTNNIALGYQAGLNFLNNESGNIDIGNTGVAGENNIIRVGTSQTATYLVGTVYANGVSISSDRRVKENFAPVDTQAVLAKVASLPVTEWNYNKDTKDVQHIGPMAQDFQSAFGFDGADDKHISLGDEGGVALAAIQGLNQKLNDKEAEIQHLQRQNDALTQRLNALEAALRELAARK